MWWECCLPCASGMRSWAAKSCVRVGDHQRLARLELNGRPARADVRRARGVGDGQRDRRDHAVAVAEPEAAHRLARVVAGRVGELLAALEHGRERARSRAVPDDEPDPPGGDVDGSGQRGLDRHLVALDPAQARAGIERGDRRRLALGERDLRRLGGGRAHDHLAARLVSDSGAAGAEVDHLARLHQHPAGVAEAPRRRICAEEVGVQRAEEPRAASGRRPMRDRAERDGARCRRRVQGLSEQSAHADRRASTRACRCPASARFASSPAGA